QYLPCTPSSFSAACSMSHTHTHAACFVSGEKRFGLTKTRNYKVFTYTELSRESSKVRHDSFF
ncbi:putative phenylalanine--tRNA ligase, partial [Triplophysa rosa]